MKCNADALAFPYEYVTQQLLQIKAAYNVSTAALAKIAGQERISFARALRTGKVSTIGLYRLSVHFGLPVSFWFPPIHALAVPIQVEPPKTCLCHDAAPLSLEILKAVKPLPAVQKQALLKAVTTAQNANSAVSRETCPAS